MFLRTKTYDDKQEAIKQWTEDPCGMSRVRDFEPESKEFYERIDESRYGQYAPWMKSTLVFHNYPGKKVLEVGFGMGTDLFQFALAGSDVTGIDLSPAHLDIAKKRFSLYGKDADLRLGDAEKIPFSDATFDVVYSFGVIHHTPDANMAMDEIYRVLKPGGRAIIGVYHKWSAFFLLSVLLPYLWRLRFLKESYRQTLSQIEHREHSDACPLVKVYSRRGLRQLLQNLDEVHIECKHLKRFHFGPARRFMTNESCRKLESTLGWYLIAKCRKRL